MDHPNAALGPHPTFGEGVFATGPILRGEEIATFDGTIYEGLENADFPPEVVNHAITFARDRARDSEGIARFLNHSCSPNAGLRGQFHIVAMRDIEAGEEICWDYDMSEDHDWSMPCSCGSPHCRREIRGFRFLPESIRQRYTGFVADWLVEKYDLEKN